MIASNIEDKLDTPMELADINDEFEMEMDMDIDLECDDEDLIQFVDDNVSSNPLTDYVNSISKYKILTAEEELELAMRVFNGDEEAKQELINHNLRLAMNIANKYKTSGVDFLDLIQEANIGLMTAVDKFDYSKGFRFSTYAYWWIKQAIQRYIGNCGRAIRIPIHTMDDIIKLRKTIAILNRELGREPETKEIVDKTGFTYNKVVYLMNISQDTVSLDAPVSATGELKDGVLGDFLANPEDESALPEAVYANMELSEKVAEMLSTLNERESYVIRQRFGFNEYNETKTLEEIGNELKITRERVRQIESRALHKLRAPSKRRLLEGFIAQV